MNNTFNEGDINSNKRGTCARANNGKVRLSLFPMHLLAGATRVLMWGATKYAEWNWAKGGRWSTAFDCMMRHMLKWWFFREEYDEESGMHHLDHALCNLMFLIHFKETYKKGDDRPPQDITCFHDSIDNFNLRWKQDTENQLKPVHLRNIKQAKNTPEPTLKITNRQCDGCKIPKFGNCSELCPYESNPVPEEL